MILFGLWIFYRNFYTLSLIIVLRCFFLQFAFTMNPEKQSILIGLGKWHNLE